MKSLSEIIKIRLKKRKTLKDLGDNPYPIFVKRTHSIQEAIDEFFKLSKEKKLIKLTGRLMTLREHGALTFGNLKDGGNQIQIAFRRDGMGKSAYEELSKLVDIGDFLNVEGVLFKTKRGEKTLDVRKFNIISKSLQPLPEKWHGLKDVEQRYRKRYLDILMNEEVSDIFKKRSKIIKEARSFLETNDFLEVETPILQQIPGGASAKPFKTHLNALNLDMYLRISPELYLKRLLVGGFDRVYEIGRNFRNEGMDYSHNPEFTMLEFYWAYSNYKEGMRFTEKLLRHILKQVVGGYKVEYSSHGDAVKKVSNVIDFSKTFTRIEFSELLQKYTKINYEDHNLESLRKKAKELGVKIAKKAYSKIEIADAIYKKICLPRLVQPTFVIHHPTSMLPLAKPLEDNPKYAASFQLIVAGWELVKGYSELNDPVLQKEFFKSQQTLRSEGNDEAQFMDEDFIEALEYGMPPAFGFGMGMDRLTALLTDAHSLREVILFPTMRPK